jgi:chitinase
MQVNFGFRNFILTSFVPSERSRIDDGYDVKKVCKYLDYISVATYDYTGQYDVKTGYNSPLYSRLPTGNSANSSINYWIQRGCPRKKILMGIPTYARAFKIVNKQNKVSTTNLIYLGINSQPFTNPSYYTSEEGILSYYEICELIAKKNTKIYWDDLVN